MKYTVLRIDEDIDFGCEERAADAPVMAVVTIRNEDGVETKVRQIDQMLYDRDINVGDEVIINKKQELQKSFDDEDMDKLQNGIAYYHLPGLFEFYELYRVFLPLFFEHREYFYDWCEIGSIYGAPADCIWGGGRIGFGDHDPREVLELIRE